MALFRGMGARKDATRGTSPIEVRKSIAALFARPGILQGAASPLLTGDATWAYHVGIANFVTSRGASDGDQLYGNDGVALIGTTGVGSTVPIAPGVGLQRIDIAWTRHPTNTENADTSSEPMFGVESGVAASSNPVAPVIPAGALEIGRNTMTSAATSTLSAGNTITQSALYTALRGTPVSFRNQAERDAYPAPYDGLTGYRLDLHCVDRYNGTAWVGGNTGWITPTLAAGWSPASVVPQYRRLNGVVYFQGRAASTGGLATAFSMPAGFLPAVTLVFLGENSGASMRCQVSTAGGVGQIAAASAVSLSFNSCAPYPADA